MRRPSPAGLGTSAGGHAVKYVQCQVDILPDMPATSAHSHQVLHHRFPDLGATIQCTAACPLLAAQLPERYSSVFCTLEYFDLYDHPPNLNACVLDQPDHVVLFTVKGRTIDILNKLIDIEPEAVARVAAAIFRAFPTARRIRTEVKYQPAELRLPLRVRYRAEDLVVDLPATEDDYRASLGKTTRKHLQQYANQLRRRYPDATMTVREREEISLEVVEQVAEWNRQRMREKGDLSSYERDPEAIRPLWAMLQRHGMALCCSIGGAPAAGQLILRVGDDTWVHTVGFDSRYADVHLGLTMTYTSIVESIRRGCRRVHLLFGTPIYKERLGAVPVAAYQISIYRSPLLKLAYAREAWSVLVVNRKRIYWRVRGRLKQRLLGGGRAAPPTVYP